MQEHRGDLFDDFVHAAPPSNTMPNVRPSCHRTSPCRFAANAATIVVPVLTRRRKFHGARLRLLYAHVSV